MRRPLRIVLAVAVVLLGARAALPAALEAYVNRVLDRTRGYDGRIEDVDVALWRGAYAIEGLRLDHEEKTELRPLLAADRIDLSVHWGALLRGAVVGEVHARGLVYNVVAAPPESDDALAQSGEEPALSERLSALFPFSIDRLEVQDGELHYRDPHRSPPVDIALTDVRGVARDWSNVRSREGRLGRAWLEGRAFDSARFAAALEADPLASPPRFAFAAVSEGIRLTKLNEFLRAYAGFDAQEGLLDVYTEIEAADGRFHGYVKPVVSALDVVGEEERDDWGARAWEGVVGLAAEVFENQEADRQASRIPIEGAWGEATPDLLGAVGSALHNAFVEALPRGLEAPERLDPEP